jgi:hypothetical protein
MPVSRAIACGFHAIEVIAFAQGNSVSLSVIAPADNELLPSGSGFVHSVDKATPSRYPFK